MERWEAQEMLEEMCEQRGERDPVDDQYDGLHPFYGSMFDGEEEETVSEGV